MCLHEGVGNHGETLPGGSINKLELTLREWQIQFVESYAMSFPSNNLLSQVFTNPYKMCYLQLRDLGSPLYVHPFFLAQWKEEQVGIYLV